MNVEEVAQDCMMHVDTAEAHGWTCINHYQHDHMLGGLVGVTSTLIKAGVDHIVHCDYQPVDSARRQFVWSGYRLSTWAWTLPDPDGLPFGFTYQIGCRSKLEDLLVDDIAPHLPMLHIKKKSEA